MKEQQASRVCNSRMQRTRTIRDRTERKFKEHEDTAETVDSSGLLPHSDVRSIGLECPSAAVQLSRTRKGRLHGKLLPRGVHSVLTSRTNPSPQAVFALLYPAVESLQVWEYNNRIKLHLALTAIAIAVDVGIAFVGVYIVANDNGGTMDNSIAMTIGTWQMRNAHIALDTIVLHFALATPIFSLNSDNSHICSIACDQDTPISLSHKECSDPIMVW